MTRPIGYEDFSSYDSPPLPDDQGTDTGRIDLVQEGVELLLPGALVLVGVDRDPPGGGVGGGPGGATVRPGLEIDGRKAEQLVQVIHGHGPELLVTATD